MKKMKNAGFSLVELIVVIAIMAILVGVAVPVYTGYIEKTQKAKDEQLVEEIKHAMEIAAIGDEWHKELTGDKLTGIGMIVVKENGTTVVPFTNTSAADLSEKIEEAMEATFGTNYTDDLTLSYDGWTGTLDGTGSIAIAGSAYAKDTEGLLKTVQNITDAFAGVADKMDDAIKSEINALLGTTDATAAQLANGMMLYVASKTNEKLSNESDKNAFLIESWGSGEAGRLLDEHAALAADYAYVQAYVTHSGCELLQGEFSKYIGDSPLSVIDNHSCTSCANKLSEIASKAASDANAYLSVLDQITASKEIIINNSDSQQLYTGTSLKQYVSAYISVAELVQSTNAADGDVVIVISMDQTGAVSSTVYPLDY